MIYIREKEAVFKTVRLSTNIPTIMSPLNYLCFKNYSHGTWEDQCDFPSHESRGFQLMSVTESSNRSEV